jgi:hypothetical protein
MRGEALSVSVAQGEITVDQLKRQLEDGLAYVEDQGVDNIAEELLIALAGLLITHRPAAADLRLWKSHSAPSTIHAIQQSRISRFDYDNCHSASAVRTQI